MMNHDTRRIQSFAILAMVIMALVGCAPSGESARESASARVTILLNWFPESQHGGFYAALVHGYFADEGLDVEIQPGGVDIPVVQMVDTGRSMFGVTNADDILIGRAQGARLVAVMAPLQQSPRCLIVDADSDIQSFDDLRNITMAMSSRATYSHFLRHHLPLDGVEIVGYPGNVAPLLQGRVQALQAYNFSEPFIASQQGMETRALMVSELGFNPYTSVLATRDRVIADDPELVERVVRASIRGWETYLEDPDETNRYINSLNSEMSMEILRFGVDTLEDLVLHGDALERGIGTMSPERWNTLSRQLVEIEVMPPTGPAPDTAWTGRFLPGDE